MQVPLSKPFLNQDEASAAAATVLSGWVTQGPRVEEFEHKFAQTVGSQYAVAVSNCTTALHLSMLVSGIGPGDEVICPTMSFIATANAIVHSGATPVFADIDSKTWNLDLKDTQKRITKKTKAILLVHQIGLPADIEAFQALARRHKLVLIEDAACAAGSSYHGKRIGSHSDLVCFSFHPRKVITTGDGGMITTSRADYSERLKHLRHHGMSINDRARHESKQVLFEEYTEIGFNYRMTDIQAAVGIEQLKKLDSIVKERRRIAEMYNEAFYKVAGIHLLQEPNGSVWNYQSYPICLNRSSPEQRNALMQTLLDKGIASRRGIMTAHREKAYEGRGVYTELVHSENACDHSLFLPLYVPMSDAEVQYVIGSVIDGCRSLNVRPS